MADSIAGFEIDRVLRTNQRYDIYVAHREGEQAQFVLKVLFDAPEQVTAAAGLRREYSLLKDLDLDSIAKCHEYIIDGTTHILVLDSCPGTDLTEVVARELVALDEIFEISIQTARAVGELHSRNIIHKDINPSNLMWDPESQRVRVLDFGISTRLSREQTQVASVDQLEGTLLYMSPEQTGRMNRPLTYHTDLYSLGATLYQLMTKCPVFEAEDALGYIAAHISEMPAEPAQLSSDIPQGLSQIVMKLLSKKSETRFQDNHFLIYRRNFVQVHHDIVSR